MHGAPSSIDPGAKIALEYGRDWNFSVGARHFALLKAVARLGSISAAARSNGLSYRGAWLMMSDLETCIGCHLLVRARGGTGGGGARISPAGGELIALISNLESQMRRALKTLGDHEDDVPGA